MIKSFVKRLIALWKKYEHHLGVGAIVLGFIFDLFLAKRPDSVIDNVLLISYLFIAAAIIVILNLRQGRARKFADQGLVAAEPLILLLMLQFCFGGLASNLLVLYGHSGTLAGSTLFILLLMGLVFGNEFLRTRYAQLRFNIAVYYTVLFSYLIIAVPTFLVHSIGVWVFLFSGFLSLVIVSVFLAVVYTAVLRGKTKRQQLIEVAVLVLCIFAIINGLYFLNIIPPVPLSLKAIGVYHSLSRGKDGTYTATYEPAPWYVFWRDTSSTFTYEPGSVAYCFSAVYAPSNLKTPIVHLWERYDTQKKSWVDVSHISFTIVGGRAQGYKGYSVETLVAPGAWRCDIETAQGQLIGRIDFTAIESTTTPTLSTATI